MVRPHPPLYSPVEAQVRVVVGAQNEWRSPNPDKAIWDAYVKRPGGGTIESYLIIIDSKVPIVPEDPATWQGLQGKIVEAVYLPEVDAFLPRYQVTNSQPQLGRSVEIPDAILTAAGIDRQGTFNVSSLNLERSLSPTDLAYVRANCPR